MDTCLSYVDCFLNCFIRYFSFVWIFRIQMGHCSLVWPDTHSLCEYNPSENWPGNNRRAESGYRNGVVFLRTEGCIWGLFYSGQFQTFLFALGFGTEFLLPCWGIVKSSTWFFRTVYSIGLISCIQTSISATKWALVQSVCVTYKVRGV